MFTELVDFERDSRGDHVILADLRHSGRPVGISGGYLDDVLVLAAFVDDRRVVLLVPDRRKLVGVVDVDVHALSDGNDQEKRKSQKFNTLDFLNKKTAEIRN